MSDEKEKAETGGLPDDKLALLKKLDAALDKAFESDATLDEDRIRQLMSGDPDLEGAAPRILSQLAGEAIFDQGVAEDAPHLLELTADLESNLHEGTLLASYRVISQLGSGGMGDVYLAERADGQYEKQVALKILTTGLASPTLLNRFKRERQILAELRHSAIAPLLDAGIAEDGRPWFVLEYIRGLPLIEYCDRHELEPESRIELFLQVCDAIAFANENGVVHRDLKPGNILIEDTATGPRPYVLDFGIAMREEDDNLTRTGHMLGTPAYMSPEQASGAGDAVDQRSDVFSLGVLLYELIDHRKPFIGNNATETSYHIIHRDTPPLQQKRVSADLVAIIFKALNKSPGDRYATVRLLMDDLDNYRRGRPISAHPAGPWFRLRRKVARYPVISTVVLITLFMLAGLLSYSLSQRASKQQFAEQQAQIAQQYSQAAEQIDSTAKLIYSRPLHDIEPELSTLSDEYQALQSGLPDMEPATRRVVRYALGRAALSLGRVENARQLLEAAWNSGIEDPLLALSLGQAYSRLYANAVKRTALLSHAETRTQALLKARDDYVRPARFYLVKGAQASHQDAIVAKAIMLHFDGDSATAVKVLRDAVDEVAWPVTAIVQAGEIYLDMAETRNQNGDEAGAAEALRDAIGFFQQAVEIARSHPQALEGHCVALTRLVQVRPAEQVDLAPCDALVATRPTSADSLVHAGSVYATTGRQLQSQGQSPESRLVKASDLADQALAAQENNPQALRLRGAIHLTRSTWLAETGQDGTAELQHAVSSLEAAAAVTPGDAILLEELARALQHAGRMAYSTGGDGDPVYQRSIQLLDKMNAQPDARFSTRILLADTLTWRGYYRYTTGRDAQSDLGRAMVLAKELKVGRPDNAKANRTLALAAWTLAEFLFLVGEDAGEAGRLAAESYKQVITQNPADYKARYNLVGALSTLIINNLERQQPQVQELESMRQELDALRQSVDDDLVLDQQWATYWMYQARQAILDKRDPRETLVKVRSLQTTSSGHDIDSYEAMQGLGYLAQVEHRWRLDTGNWEQRLFEQDLSRLGKGIGKYPEFYLLRANRGRLALLGLSKDSTASAHVVRTTATAARDDLAQAIKGNPLLEKRYGPYLAKAENMLE